MKTSNLLHIFLVLCLLWLAAICDPAQAARCYGNNPCNACSSCGYCQHCNSGGNPCGVLLGQRRTAVPIHALTVPHQSVKRKIKLVQPTYSFSPRARLKPSSVAPYSTPLEIRQIPAEATPDSSSLPEPSPEPMGRPIRSVGSDSSLLDNQAPKLSAVWHLQLIPSLVSGCPESMVGFRHWTDMQRPGLIETWDRWAKNLLHKIYSKLSVERGQQSNFDTFIIYVRSDRRIKVRDEGYSSTGNISRFKTIVESLNGSAELDFPTSLQADTVFLTGQLAYKTLDIERDVWGRPLPIENPERNRYAW